MFTVDQIKTSFKSNQAEHLKLVNEVKEKGESFRRSLTPKQQFKLYNWAFLDPFQKTKAKPPRPRTVSICFQTNAIKMSLFHVKVAEC